MQCPEPGLLELGAGAAAAAYAVGMLMVHHFLDREADLAAIPWKTTSIVYLGLANGRHYAVAWDAVSLLAALAAGTLLDPLIGLAVIPAVLMVGVELALAPPAQLEGLAE